MAKKAIGCKLGGGLPPARSAAEPPVKRRLVEAGETVMAQPAQVAVKEGAQVGNAVFQHRDTVDPHAKGKALPFVRVNAAGLKHLGVHHARAQHFEPAVAFAHLERAIHPGTLDVDLCRGFGEGEVRGAEARLDAVDFEIGREEFLEHPFQVRHRDVLVDGKALDLMEHRRVCLVVIGTVDTTGADDAQRRALRLHRADLHWACMGAQHVGRAIVALGA